MLSPALVIASSFAYLLLLFAVAYWADRRAQAGRSVIANPWTYALSLAVYCTAWTYFGSVGRAASGGVWFLPIYLGPTLVMVLGWIVLRKMIRIAKAYRITSIADFVASRYGKSPLLAGLVTLIAVVGIVPYIALQLKAVSAGYALLTVPGGVADPAHWSRDSAFYVALVLAGFAMVFGARHLDTTERHEGMVAAIAFESVVKLVAFLMVGFFVVYGLFDGLGDLFARAQAVPQLQQLLRLEQGGQFAWAQWFGLMLLSMFSVVFLPRQFQVMVVENVREDHLRRAVWVVPLYMLLINLFVLPIALGGLLYFGPGQGNAENFVLSLPLAAGQHALALFAFVGGLSAATGMVIVETVAVSTMVRSATSWCCPCCCAGATCAAAAGRTSRAFCWASGAPPFWACWCWVMFTFTSRVRRTRWSASGSSALPPWRSLHPWCWAACTGRAEPAWARSRACWRAF